MKELNLRVKDNIKVAVRRFTPDPNGDVISRDGIKGFYNGWEIQKVHNLLTDAGRDFLHLQGYETTGLGNNGGNYIAVSSDTNSPADGDTTLTGEITTAGLGRSQGTVAHNSGETTTTITKTFTASDTHTAVQKSSLFTASTAGTMLHEATFTPVTLANNDQLQVSWSITLND